jgi:hypothetical protein
VISVLLRSIRRRRVERTKAMRSSPASVPGRHWEGLTAADDDATAGADKAGVGMSLAYVITLGNENAML